MWGPPNPSRSLAWLIHSYTHATIQAIHSLMAHNEIVGCPKFSSLFFPEMLSALWRARFMCVNVNACFKSFFIGFTVYYIALICCWLAGSFIKLLSHFIYRTARAARLLCGTFRVASANSSQIIKLILIAPHVPLRGNRKSNLEPVSMEFSLSLSLV